MYKVAICDDEKSSAAEAAELLEKYRDAHSRIEMSVDVFYSSLDLLEAIEKNAYDIYLLDIYIDRLNGIEIAESIRKRDESGEIIFMTSSNAFYKEAFRINAAHYLEKPILEEEFFDAMDRVCKKEDIRFLTIRESGEVSKIPVDDIVYIQSDDHYKRIVTDEKSFFVRSTMQALLDEINTDYFHSLGMKTVINLKKVLKINSDTLSMEDGTEFAVPRGTYRALSELVLKYAF
ncbi:LytR/AlgR family response regulator transcription factor [Butyrivibrio sp. YAB3001]|uniref:LytR/AlgR family response regulator transcription factor n=1 Tax=Butyrivibrio sp. YAB3001 TaxID=1520812 RepID=UPI0008F633BA|nr:LytTR family DNA-binding domain-containing protein [Butyrivibrio sp. YAB3001]SFC19530.1 two component transcriptional regulator, LytTR family [Butyrivibrio sp. YAB3001]